MTSPLGVAVGLLSIYEVYLQINYCVSFWLHGCCGEWEGGPVNQVNHTSWVAVVTPTDRPKSVRNRCLIELFCCLCKGFCHRTGSDLLLFVLTSSIQVYRNKRATRTRNNYIIFQVVIFKSTRTIFLNQSYGQGHRDVTRKNFIISCHAKKKSLSLILSAFVTGRRATKYKMPPIFITMYNNLIFKNEYFHYQDV